MCEEIMPVYQYECEICGQHFERRLPIEQAGVTQICPAGHLHVRRVFLSPTVVFKGSGFYSTDHPKTTRGKTR